MEKILFAYVDYSRELTVTETEIFLTINNGGYSDKQRIENIEITEKLQNELSKIYYDNLSALNLNKAVKEKFLEIIAKNLNGLK